MFRISLLAICLLGTTAVYAEESTDTVEPLPSPLDMEVEFGYQAHTGNTNNESINGRLAASYIEGRYRTTGEFKYYKLDKDGVEDKNQSNYKIQSDYKLGPRTYLYGNFNGVDSKYSAYFKDYTFSGGVGYQFSHTDDFTLEAELGPGYRHQQPNLDELDDDDLIFPHNVDEAIFRGNINSVWQILDNLAFSADVSVVAGRSNARWDSELSLTNNITDQVKLKVIHNRTYHDKVPSNLEKTDSVTSVNLLVHF
ncbi:DUF481 domain-containing protein [Vibrio sp. SCSIO 43136]|uniref:DUF481 domain-containing protein n=1 Tax=Vibrio sp. SCSIO 43136 TaxID=2819101 RepID=UPI0020750895|nr:DUF481 domain-containing protein [Vibrio sp. SCSIO 43136]USD65049.1 DUF481 domain-containing protein [Vibrio sp. SCSIO 43136]